MLSESVPASVWGYSANFACANTDDLNGDGSDAARIQILTGPLLWWEKTYSKAIPRAVLTTN